jgi:hypothetical protein
MQEWSELYPGKKHETLSKKILKNKRAGGMAQVIECLSSKYEALRSKHRSPKQNANVFVVMPATTGIGLCLDLLEEWLVS